MRIHKVNEWKIAFYIRYGHFGYYVMYLGLSNAPASFYEYVNKIFVKKLDIFVIVYLHDIVVYTDISGQLYVDIVY